MATDNHTDLVKLVLWLKPREMRALLDLVWGDRERFKYLAEYLEAVAELHLEEVA
jgi:hypothetical protein